MVEFYGKCREIYHDMDPMDMKVYETSKSFKNSRLGMFWGKIFDHYQKVLEGAFSYIQAIFSIGELYI